jgi:hypothetical protein
MSRRLFKVVAILVLFSMLVVPVSAKPVYTGSSQGTAQSTNPSDKFELEAVDPSQVTQVGNPSEYVKGKVLGVSAT